MAVLGGVPAPLAGAESLMSWLDQRGEEETPAEPGPQPAGTSVPASPVPCPPPPRALLPAVGRRESKGGTTI